MTTIVILALVFVFVALRLWSVLGRRTGHEQTPLKPFERATVPAIPLPGRDPQPAPASESVSAPAAVAGLRSISSADPKFEIARFVDGAKSAYGMILDAYWKGDVEALRPLVGEEVGEAFSAAIEQRKEAGLKLDNRLVAIEQAQVEEAWVDNGVASIRIRFDADVAAVTRDAEDQVVAGSLTDAVPTHDVWTFSRALKADNPNWTLTETDEAA